MKQIMEPNVYDRLSRSLRPIATGNSGQVREIVQCDCRMTVNELSMTFLTADSRCFCCPEIPHCVTSLHDETEHGD